MALAKSQAYQDAADAPATLRAYAADLKNYEAWCARRGLAALPATPDVVGAYLAAAGEGYAMQTLRRRVAAIAHASGVAGHPLDTKHPAIRETLRGIGRTHGSRGRRSAALTTKELKALSGVCEPGLAGDRDRALLLLGFAGTLRRSELVALDVERLTWSDEVVKLLLATKFMHACVPSAARRWQAAREAGRAHRAAEVSRQAELPNVPEGVESGPFAPARAGRESLRACGVRFPIEVSALRARSRSQRRMHTLVEEAGSVHLHY
jgi:hypothetical protein